MVIKWHHYKLKTVQFIDDMDDVQLMTWRWAEGVWWVIESVFFNSSDKGF